MNKNDSRKSSAGRYYFRFCVKLAIFLSFWNIFFPFAANAAEIINLSSALTRNQKSQSTYFDAYFYLPTALTESQSLSLTFVTSTPGQANFTFLSTGSSTRDMYLSTATPGAIDNQTRCTSDVTVPFPPPLPISTTSTEATATLWGFATSTATGGSYAGSPQFILTAPSSAGTYLDGGICVAIAIGDPFEGDPIFDTPLQNMLTNPASSTGANPILLKVSTPSDFGQSALSIIDNDQVTVAATNTPAMTFELGILDGNTLCSNETSVASMTLSGLSLNFFDLRADYIEGSSNHLCTRVSSNAPNGVAVQIKSAYGRMTSTKANVTFPASAQTASSSTIVDSNLDGLNTSNEAYGACVAIAGAVRTPSAGPDSSVPLVTEGYNQGGSTIDASLCGWGSGMQNLAFNSTNAIMRLLSTNFDTVWTTTGATYLAYADINLRAAVTVNTPASNSYTDTLTVIAFATF